MSHVDPTGRISALREALRALEAAPRQRADRVAPLGGGALRLDGQLGGGLKRASLHEVIASHRCDDGAAAGFSAALALRCAETGPHGRGQGGFIVWVVEDCAAHETGVPYYPGLAAYGFDPRRLVVVRTAGGRATLWALEEALRLKAPVVLAELWGAKHYGLAPSRRLLLAAQDGGGTAILLHAGLAGRADTLSSAAETRFAVASHPSPRLPSAGNRMPLPGGSAFAVRLLKLRLGAGRHLDDRVHPLVWNPAQRCFDDHPLRFGVSAFLADRQAQAFVPGRAAG